MNKDHTPTRRDIRDIMARSKECSGFGLGVQVFIAELQTLTAAKPQGHPLRVQGELDAIPYTDEIGCSNKININILKFSYISIHVENVRRCKYLKHCLGCDVTR